MNREFEVNGYFANKQIHEKSISEGVKWSMLNSEIILTDKDIEHNFAPNTAKELLEAKIEYDTWLDSIN